jgi:hypothetical protein
MSVSNNYSFSIKAIESLQDFELRGKLYKKSLSSSIFDSFIYYIQHPQLLYILSAARV